MKLLKLEIKNVRGIPDLTVTPNGNSLVIYGANGSGKSAVIDAIDFLLTGKIARLEGDGTVDISLKMHGPHINVDLDKVEVNAVIKLHGVDDPIAISRKMSRPATLEYDSRFEKELAPILELLNRGQYVFTRREVLKLITSKSSERAEEIQKVLKLGQLTDVREKLVKVHGEYKRQHKNAKDAVEKAEREIMAITAHAKFLEDDVLKFVNEQRVILKGSEIDKPTSELLKQGIAGIPTNLTHVNHTDLTERVLKLQPLEIQEIAKDIPTANEELKQVLNEIKADTEANWNSKRHKLTIEGLKLVRESGECPLCDYSWSNGELKNVLQTRIDSQSSRQEKIERSSEKIKHAADKLAQLILQLRETVRPISSNVSAKENDTIIKTAGLFADWTEKLDALSKAMASPLEKYKDDFLDADVNNLFVPENVQDILATFETEVKKLFPKATPEQSAWDNLTKLTERFKVLEDHCIAFAESNDLMNKAGLLVEKFVSARDEVLDSLYNKIKDRFVQLYKEMHGQDEKGFDAEFEPQDSKLNMRVDFHGKGLHPPHALHSEGHQDSMGVCLFLSLSEYLNTGLIDLITLDDVVTSIDTGHRGEFCDVLMRNFKDKQFIITTHENAWAHQLKGSGLVKGNQMLKFSNWKVGQGPIVHYQPTMWTRIYEDIANDNIAEASAKLRRGLEEFFRQACHDLKASIPYTQDDSGSLGEFLSGAIGKYKSLLKEAKASAQSWAKHDEMEKLKAIDDASKAVIAKTEQEKWIVNPTVHFNSWDNFKKEDFLPVVEAFKDLCEKIFSCENAECQSGLKLTPDKTILKCRCNSISWNLVSK